MPSWAPASCPVASWVLHPKCPLPLCPKLSDGAHLTVPLAQSPYSDPHHIAQPCLLNSPAGLHTIFPGSWLCPFNPEPLTKSQEMSLPSVAALSNPGSAADRESLEHIHLFPRLHPSVWVQMGPSDPAPSANRALRPCVGLGPALLCQLWVPGRCWPAWFPEYTSSPAS